MAIETFHSSILEQIMQKISRTRKSFESRARKDGRRGDADGHVCVARCTQIVIEAVSDN